MWVRGKLHAPAVLRPGKTPFSMYRRLSGPQDPLWKGAEILANTEIQSYCQSALWSGAMLQYTAGPCVNWFGFNKLSNKQTSLGHNIHKATV
jgi:hypothetical protein